MGYVGPSTIRNWLRGENLPPTVTPLEIQLFGDKAKLDDEQYGRWRLQLREAYAKAKGEKENPETSPAQTPLKPSNLPFISLGSLFKGRERFLDELHTALTQAADVAVVGKVLHGLGGVGKTRVAVEYALRHAAEYTASLFIACETPERLNTSLAALVGADALDLLPKAAPQEETKILAVLEWLKRNPGWLMILDNVDDAKAGKAVVDLLPRLRGGRVIITGRLRNFPASVRKLELGILSPEDALDYLLECTQGYRITSANDPACAKELVTELGGLALGLEQAAAYISTKVTSFERYLKLWRERRETVVKWFDKDLMTYNHDTGLAATWATTVKSLPIHSRRLLERLAFLSPEPIPDTLLDAAIPEDIADFDAHDARAGLYAYSLASPVELSGAAAGFVVHRLVQDFTRMAMTEERRDDALQEARRWIEVACADKPVNVWDWRHDDLLKPHAVGVADARIAAAKRKVSPDSPIYAEFVLDVYRYFDPMVARNIILETTASARKTLENTIEMARLLALSAELSLKYFPHETRDKYVGYLFEAASIFLNWKYHEEFSYAANTAAHYIDMSRGGDIKSYYKYICVCSESANKFGDVLYFKIRLIAMFVDNASSDLLGFIRDHLPDDDDTLSWCNWRMLELVAQHARMNDEKAFISEWICICGVLECRKELCWSFALAAYVLVLERKRWLSHPLAQDAVELIVQSLSDNIAEKTAAIRNAYLEWNILLLRIKIINQLCSRDYAIFANCSNFIERFSDNEDVEVSVNLLVDISDIIDIHILTKEVLRLSSEIVKRGDRDSLALRKLQVAYATRLFTEGRSDEAIQIVTGAFDHAKQWAISNEHKSVKQLRELLEGFGGASASNLEPAGDPESRASRAGRVIRGTKISLMQDTAIDVIINARGKVCIYMNAPPPNEIIGISYINRYITLHFFGGDYYIIDTEMSDGINRSIREAAAAGSWYVFFINHGTAISGWSIPCAIDDWLE